MAAQEPVPAPAKTPARVLVSGRTSTLQEVQVHKAGNRIPRTFSGDRVKNTPGFSWYVSQHWAFKTDYSAERARFYLELLEMAYPHYVELFGREPEGLAEKRMAVVYASSADQLKKALLSDGIAWNFNGGGITFEGYFCAYNYPSGTLQYHQRYIVLHEWRHLFQMCLNGTVGTMPGWYNEGVADSLGHHVHDPVKNQLTVNVLDKAAITNYLDQGLETHRRKPISVQDVHKAGGAAREVGFLLVHYFSDEPDRLQRFRIWRDEMFRLKQHGKDQHELSARLLQDLFGPWPKIEADFRTWVSRRRHTFHYVEWGWEQEADTLWSYGFAGGGKLSQTDVLLPPGDKPAADPLRLDYPHEPVADLVGPVQRGVREPVVGVLIDFSRSVGQGRAGIGLGVSHAPALTPFEPGQLFLDAGGKQPGVHVIAHRLAQPPAPPIKPGDLKLGASIGESDDAALGMAEKGSIARLAGKNTVVDWQGWLRIQRPDDYVVGLSGNAGSWLWLDDNLVLERGTQSGPVVTNARIKLTAGLHRLKLRHWHRDGAKSLAVGWSSGTMPVGCLRLLIERGQQLVLDGTDLGLERKVVDLPAELRQAMTAGGQRLGMTVRIAERSLEVTLRAKAAKADKAVSMQATIPLDVASRQRLLAQPLALLSRDGRHGVTPFFDDGRVPSPDLSLPAPANRWRNPGDALLGRLVRASWRLGDQTPASLSALRQQMHQAADQAPEVQRAAVTAYERDIKRIRQDVRECEADADSIAKALAELEDRGR